MKVFLIALSLALASSLGVAAEPWPAKAVHVIVPFPAGGPSDIVVEPNIVRAMPNRDQMAPRPAVGEQPPRIAPLPDATWSDEAARSETRSTDAFDHHAEPQMPEPPPRPARPWCELPLDERRRCLDERAVTGRFSV